MNASAPDRWESLKRLKSLWGFALSAIFLLLAYSTPLRDNLKPALEFWQAVPKALSEITAWQNNRLGVVLGSVVPFVLVFACAVSLVFLLWHFRLRLLVGVAQVKAKFEIQKQMDRAVCSARPKVAPHKDKVLWNRLAAAALQGHADRTVLEQHCHEGNPDRPVLFCNFQSYAKAVVSVREVLDGLQDGPPYPRVYTLLRRTIVDWYNPFPYEWLEDANGCRAQVTHQWWEDYKDGVAKQAHPAVGQRSNILMMRLVADPGPPSEVQDYAVYSGTALELEDARQQGRNLVSEVSGWHNKIANLLSSMHSAPNDLKIHLIGKPSNNRAISLAQHFRQNFHLSEDIDVAPADKTGVFLRYMKKRSGYDELLRFNDLFLVDIPRRLKFGLAYIDDTIRDTNGVWIIPDWYLASETGNMLIGLFQKAWSEGGQADWCICNGLPPVVGSAPISSANPAQTI